MLLGSVLSSSVSQSVILTEDFDASEDSLDEVNIQEYSRTSHRGKNEITADASAWASASSQCTESNIAGVESM